jgi:DNA-binding NarL/FixJ family response regulator
MITTLIVEDDQYKLEAIEHFLKTLPSSFLIRIARSYQSALKTIRDWHPELVLLDMSLPTYEGGGGRPRPFAGKELLHEIKRRKIGSNVVIVTQFDSFGEGSEQKTLEQLRAEVSNQYHQWYRGTVYYNPAESAWRDALSRIILLIQDKS